MIAADIGSCAVPAARPPCPIATARGVLMLSAIAFAKADQAFARATDDQVAGLLRLHADAYEQLEIAARALVEAEQAYQRDAYTADVVETFGAAR